MISDCGASLTANDSKNTQDRDAIEFQHKTWLTLKNELTDRNTEQINQYPACSLSVA